MQPTILTCILCPLSCQLELQVVAGEVQAVRGNSCNQGVEYASKEYTCPTRMLTATVALQNGKVNRVPVRTRTEVPKSCITECMGAIQQLQVSAPVKRGQVLLFDLAGTGIDLLASRSIEAS